MDEEQLGTTAQTSQRNDLPPPPYSPGRKLQGALSAVSLKNDGSRSPTPPPSYTALPGTEQVCFPIYNHVTLEPKTNNPKQKKTATKTTAETGRPSRRRLTKKRPEAQNKSSSIVPTWVKTCGRRIKQMVQWAWSHGGVIGAMAMMALISGCLITVVVVFMLTLVMAFL